MQLQRPLQECGSAGTRAASRSPIDVVNLDHVVAATRDEAGKLWLRLRSRPGRVAVSRLHAHLFRAM